MYVYTVCVFGVCVHVYCVCVHVYCVVCVCVCARARVHMHTCTCDMHACMHSAYMSSIQWIPAIEDRSS